MENKKRYAATDTRSVSTDDDYAVEYWTQELNTTKSKLLAAVTAVGDSFDAVKKHLRK